MYANQPTRSIDMVTPGEVCRRLALSESALIELVNQGRLAAYNLGGHLRFKVRDVRRIEAGLVAA